MATKKRVWFPGAIYHIVCRGNHQEIIFREEIDFVIYLGILKNNLKFYDKYDYKLICYCLMSNHVHLLIKTENQDLSFFMRRLNSMYAKYFNDKYGYMGHLFQARYFDNLITNLGELLEVSRYIHLNPFKADIVKKPENYRWSSYNKILSRQDKENNKLYIHDSEILDIFDIYLIVQDGNKKQSTNDNRMKYRNYVEEKMEKMASEVNP